MEKDTLDFCVKKNNLKYPITKLISFFFLLFYFFLFLYLSYKYIFITKNLFTFNILYLIVCALLSIFWLIVLKTQNKTFRLLSLIYFITILIPLYSWEAWNNYPQLSFIFEKFDLRTKKQVYKTLSRDQNIVPTVPISKSKSNIFPLGGISNKITLFCNENGEFITYKADRYGFRNNDTVWDKKIDSVLLGDSFAHGACVDKDISYHLSKKVNLINLGYQGNGPLKMYASFEEYGKELKPKYIIWMYDSFNDLDDLNVENNNYILKKYYDLNFNQKLINKQRTIDENLNKLVKSKFESDSYRKFSHTIKLYNLRMLIKNLILNSEKEKKNVEKQFEQFKLIFDQFVKISKQIDSEIIFVFFSDKNALSKAKIDIMDEKIINFIKSKDLILINIHEIMKNSGNYKKYFPFNGRRFGHFNEAGYELVAKEIEKYLIND